MNKTLKTGLFMQLVQIIGLVIIVIGYALSGISWTANLIFTIALVTIIVAFNIFSIIMILSGLFIKEKPKELIPNEYYQNGKQLYL